MEAFRILRTGLTISPAIILDTKFFPFVPASINTGNRSYCIARYWDTIDMQAAGGLLRVRFPKAHLKAMRPFAGCCILTLHGSPHLAIMASHERLGPNATVLPDRLIILPLRCDPTQSRDGMADIYANIDNSALGFPSSRLLMTDPAYTRLFAMHETRMAVVRRCCLLDTYSLSHTLGFDLDPERPTRATHIGTWDPDEFPVGARADPTAGSPIKMSSTSQTVDTERYGDCVGSGDIRGLLTSAPAPSPILLELEYFYARACCNLLRNAIRVANVPDLGARGTARPLDHLISHLSLLPPAVQASIPTCMADLRGSFDKFIQSIREWPHPVYCPSNGILSAGLPDTNMLIPKDEDSGVPHDINVLYKELIVGFRPNSMGCEVFLLSASVPNNLFVCSNEDEAESGDLHPHLMDRSTMCTGSHVLPVASMISGSIAPMMYHIRAIIGQYNDSGRAMPWWKFLNRFDLRYLDPNDPDCEDDGSRPNADSVPHPVTGEPIPCWGPALRAANPEGLAADPPGDFVYDPETSAVHLMPVSYRRGCVPLYRTPNGLRAVTNFGESLYFLAPLSDCVRCKTDWFGEFVDPYFPEATLNNVACSSTSYHRLAETVTRSPALFLPLPLIRQQHPEWFREYDLPVVQPRVARPVDVPLPAEPISPDAEVVLPSGWGSPLRADAPPSIVSPARVQPPSSPF